MNNAKTICQTLHSRRLTRLFFLEMDEKLDSFLYDLSKVGNEILEHSSRPLYKLNVHCANAETSSSENDPVAPQDLKDMAFTTLRQVEADLRFWDDIVQHADIPQESLPDITAIGDNLCNVKSDVEKIIEKLKLSNSDAEGDFESTTSEHIFTPTPSFVQDCWRFVLSFGWRPPRGHIVTGRRRPQLRKPICASNRGNYSVSAARTGLQQSRRDVTTGLAKPTGRRRPLFQTPIQTIDFRNAVVTCGHREQQFTKRRWLPRSYS
uniref:Uncharacterized protein n=1 Tax=Schistocephalus solidus TaxID=70667 RepID=A0A0X3PIP3_SCHSO